jgi:hypothetical protein
VGVSSAHYDEHAPNVNSDTDVGLFHCPVYSGVAAVLFQRHNFSDAACKNRRRELCSLRRRKTQEPFMIYDFE